MCILLFYYLTVYIIIYFRWNTWFVMFYKVRGAAGFCYCAFFCFSIRQAKTVWVIRFLNYPINLFGCVGILALQPQSLWGKQKGRWMLLKKLPLFWICISFSEFRSLSFSWESGGNVSTEDFQSMAVRGSFLSPRQNLNLCMFQSACLEYVRNFIFI